MKKTTLILIAVLFGLFANAQNRPDWDGLKEEITLIVANDLGRNGYYDQRPIAAMMGEMAETIEPEAVLALGDVFHYEGVRSTTDPLWMSNYENIYEHPELMIEWLPVCGNHEYRGSTQAILDFSRVSRRWAMPAKYYARTFEEDGIALKVILLDTTPLIDKYRNDRPNIPMRPQRIWRPSWHGWRRSSPLPPRIGSSWPDTIRSSPKHPRAKENARICRRVLTGSSAATGWICMYADTYIISSISSPKVQPSTTS